MTESENADRDSDRDLDQIYEQADDFATEIVESDVPEPTVIAAITLRSSLDLEDVIATLQDFHLAIQAERFGSNAEGYVAPATADVDGGRISATFLPDTGEGEGGGDDE